jgi:hypothetical protein
MYTIPNDFGATHDTHCTHGCGHGICASNDTTEMFVKNTLTPPTYVEISQAAFPCGSRGSDARIAAGPVPSPTTSLVRLPLGVPGVRIWQREIYVVQSRSVPTDRQYMSSIIQQYCGDDGSQEFDLQCLHSRHLVVVRNAEPPPNPLLCSPCSFLRNPRWPLEIIGNTS